MHGHRRGKSHARVPRARGNAERNCGGSEAHEAVPGRGKEKVRKSGRTKCWTVRIISMATRTIFHTMWQVVIGIVLLDLMIFIPYKAVARYCLIGLRIFEWETYLQRLSVPTVKRNNIVSIGFSL